MDDAHEMEMETQKSSRLPSSRGGSSPSIKKAGNHRQQVRASRPKAMILSGITRSIFNTEIQSSCACRIWCGSNVSLRVSLWVI